MMRPTRFIFGTKCGGSRVRISGSDKNARYHETCLYERLKKGYLPNAVQSQCLGF